MLRTDESGYSQLGTYNANEHHHSRPKSSICNSIERNKWQPGEAQKLTGNNNYQYLEIASKMNRGMISDKPPQYHHLRNPKNS